jgi:heat shock protein HslJ
MKKFITLFLFLISSSIFAQDNKEFPDGIYFSGKGTSPDWNLTISNELEIKFTAGNKELNFKSSKEKEILPKNSPPLISLFGGSPKPAPDGWKYTSKSSKAKITITVLRNSVKIDKRDSIFYSVKVKIKDTRKKTRTFTGNGYYYADTRLVDIWLTKKIYGNDFKQSKYSRDSSFISFSINYHSASGIAGCNFYSFEADFRGSVITFRGPTVTLEMCDNNNEEMKFLGAISGKDIKYKIENDNLYLIDGDKTVLEFERKKK